MPCYHPLTGYKAKRPNPTTGKRSIVFNQAEGFRDLVVVLPCGSCIGCRLEYSRQFAARAYHELKSHEVGCSITLTYNDENLPAHGSLDKRHPVLFMKSLRERFAPRNIRAFGCGEYGDKTGRAHYHLCLFNWEFPDKKPEKKTAGGHQLYSSKILDELWKKGDALIGELNFETAAYAARYMLKKIKGKGATPYYGSRHRIAPYAISPRRPGLGADYCKKWLYDIYPADEVMIQKMGKYIPISPPKFYDKILEKMDPVLYKSVMAKRQVEIRKLKDHPDSTPRRLTVRRIVHEAQAKQLKRTLE